MEQADTQALLEYLDVNRDGERFLVAAPSAMLAAPLIIESGEPVMSVGGFMGGDPILTPDGFARLVADGQVRFALSTPFPMPGMGRTSGGDLTGWIGENGQPVERSLWNADEDTDAAAAIVEELGDRRPRPGMFGPMFSRFRPGHPANPRSVRVTRRAGSGPRPGTAGAIIGPTTTSQNRPNVLSWR